MHAEWIVWGRDGGHGLRTLRVGPLRVGGLNCWENWMPLARHGFDPAGHYARPDVFGVTLDRRWQEVVAFT